MRARRSCAPRDRRARLTLAGALVAAALVAVALAMVQIVPALAHARLSPRALGTTLEFAVELRLAVVALRC